VHIPKAPAADVTTVPVVSLLAISAALAVAGLNHGMLFASLARLEATAVWLNQADLRVAVVGKDFETPVTFGPAFGALVVR
jgi:hypothetical protein